MKYLIIGAASLAVSAPACAQDINLKPLLDARLRYEGVDQDGLPRDADAVTARVRAGIQATRGDWSVLAEAEATLAIDESYNSGVNGKTAFPIVADPQNIELNRLQLQYRGLKGALITVGRQRINLDDQRFVGAVGWRDNEQTFDAARLEWTIVPKLKADVTYAWSVRTIWGIDGFGARQQAISGDNVFATLAWTTPVGTVTGLAFLVDQDEAAISNYGMSSQTYGIRLQGVRPLSKTVKLDYALSYARQSDWHRNPLDHDADYHLVDAGISLKTLRFGAGYELLGADDGRALTSFQAPLGTLHKFQGWADKFLVTPPDGIRDLYGSAGYGWSKIGPFDAIAVIATYHRFDSDRNRRHYGDETNVQLTAKCGKWAFLLKYADYNADGLATDTRKLWASVDWTF